MVLLIVGPPATKEAFFDREEVLERIWERLKVGSVLLAAPRRFGKTSVMLRMRDFSRNNAAVLYMDTEWISEPTDFIAEMMALLINENGEGLLKKAKRISKHTLKFISETIEEAEISGVKIKLKKELQNNWQDKGRELLQIVDALDTQVIFVVDELPLMINRMLKKKGEDETEEFLFWLRALRNPGPKGLNNARFIIGGSIGIEHILSRINAIASINDLEKIQVGEFDSATAKKFIKELLKNEGIKADEKLINKILESIEVPIPYFIQVLVSVLVNEASTLKINKINPELVDEVYKKRVLGVECRTYFEHYYQRIAQYYDAIEAKAAIHILKGLSKTGRLPRKEVFGMYSIVRGENDEKGFSHLMGDLENDFYIKYHPNEDAYKFSTKVLRDWWLKYYGLAEVEDKNADL